MSNFAVSGINPYHVYQNNQLNRFENVNAPQNGKGKVGELFKNTVKTNCKEELALAAGLSASFLAADYVAKTGVAQKLITNGAKKLGASKVGQTVIGIAKQAAEAAAPLVKKAAAWFVALPAPAKAVAIAGAAITAITIAAIRRKGAKNEGKIEQKYEDMAALNR